MKRHLGRIAFAFATVFVLATSTAMSQLQQTVAVNVPFTFNVGTLLMPAGKYFLRMNDPSGTIIIRNSDGSTATFVFVTRIDRWEVRNAGPGVVFNQYGSRYFLSKIYAHNGVACRLMRGKVEKELAVKAENIPAQEIELALEKR